MANVIIIGNGPAGISAALYTTRAGVKTTIIGKDTGSLGKASEIENYYGLLNNQGSWSCFKWYIAGKRLGTEFINDEVVGLSLKITRVTTKTDNLVQADVVVIATGSCTAPPVKGLKELEGRGVSYCAVCDAFFTEVKMLLFLGMPNMLFMKLLNLHDFKQSQ